MRGAAIRPIVIAAGGTGGHFFPAEALAGELGRRGYRVALMTDARSSGLRSPAFEGRETFVLRGAGLSGRGPVRAARGALALAAGMVQARGVLRRLQPVAVVGFGGYPSVAPALAARSLARRPVLVLHEQNAVLGRANRMLAPLADALALSFDGTRRVPSGSSAAVIGNPVRPALLASRQPYAPPHGNSVRLLVLGGSLGARVFSDVVPGALAALPAEMRARIEMVQQCRAEDLDRVRTAYAALDVRAELAPFFPDVAERLGTAHLVLARAGASTVAELAVAGRPALLVPLPHAIDDHQAANAAALEAAGGAWTMRQAGMTAESLCAKLVLLLSDPAGLAAVARAAASAARPCAASDLADLVEARIQHTETTASTRGAGGAGTGRRDAASGTAAGTEGWEHRA